jgi:hypothetical protein
LGKSQTLTDEEKNKNPAQFFFILLFFSGAYYAAKYYVYHLIVSGSRADIRFSDLRLSLFPLGVEIRNIKNFPIKNGNLVSFAGVNIYLPPAEIDRPLFILNDDLLKSMTGDNALGSTFTIDHVSIRQGELIFKGRDIQFHILNFNLLSGKMTGELAIRLDSPHLKVTFPVSGEPVTLEGNLKGEVRQQGTSWSINQVVWQTREVLFNLNGRVLKDGSFYFNSSAQGNPENILRPLLGELTVKGLTYANAKVVKNVKSKVQIKADFTSPSCLIKENSCSDLSGHLNWNSQSRNLDLEAAFYTPLTRATLRVGSKSGETNITLRDIPAAAITRILDIEGDAPMAGIITSASLEINREFIRGRANLDAGPAQPLSQPFVAKGTIDFQRDKKIKQTTFSGQRLQFNGGQLSIEGKIDSQVKTTNIKIDGALENMENMATYSAYYLNIDLLPWKLSKGGGSFHLELDKRPGRKQIDSRFQITNFLVNGQSIRSLQGEVRDTPLASRGTFTISASDLSSKAELAIAAGKTTIRFQDVTGEAQKIMKILGMDLDLRGKISGDFTYSSGRALPQPELLGSITAPQLNFMGYALTQVKSALRSNLQNIALRGLEFGYKGGQARAEVSIDYGQKKFDLQGRIEGMDAARLYGGFSGRADLEISGRGEFLKDPLEISYRMGKLNFSRDREFSIKGQAKVLTDFSDFYLSTSGEALNPAGVSPFSLEISRKASRYSGSFNFNLMDLNLLIPWKNNAGTIRLLGQIYSDSEGGINGRGVAVFSGRTLSLPNFSHSLDNFQGTVTFVNKTFFLQSLSGEMGGGKVEGNGQLVIGPGGLQSMAFNLQGKNLRLYPMDRTSCLVNPDLTLKYQQKKLLLSGTLVFQSIDWQREIDERFVFSTRSELSTAESRIREMLQLDIGLNCENILMSNSLGRIQGKFKLRLTGNADFPILNGTCEGSQGEIYFSDRSFNLLKAKLVFNNNFFIDPLITIESEAFIQNYRIRFDIRGSASHAKPELLSSPPLPPQDILALISLGEIFKRSGSAEISSQQGSTAMITTKLTEEIKNRANKLLGINLLRIDPNLSGQSALDTSRLTIGKTISKDLVVVYSTNLATSRQEILYLQYQLSPAISLIAMRNEEGRYSLDLRLRTRH